MAGLAGATLMEPRRTRSNQPVKPPSRPAGSAGPTVKTPRAPELIEKQAKRDQDFVPNPDFAITALGSPNDNPSDRKVFAEVEVNRRPRRGFMADTRNDFYVWVDAGSPSAFAVPSSAALDELDRGIWLDVVFHLGDLTKRDELFVPAELGQRSDSICFSFDLPSNAEIDGTMIFWNRRTGQAWEVVAVLGSATPNGDSPFEMISIERDRRATAVRDRNDVHSAPEVIGLINIDGDLLRFHTQSQQMFSARGVEEWGVDIGDDLHALQLAFPRAIHEWTNPQVVEILASIARVGATLRTAVIGDHAAAPTDEHIQLINTNQVNHLPIEFLYDHPAPTGDGVQILQSCIAALADPAIVRCSCPPEGRADVVCPFGFWGVAKVVERLEASRDRVNRHARAVPDRFLPAPATTLFGVSNRIAGDAVIDLRDALSGPGAVIDVRQAGDWDAWRSNVQQDPVEDLLLALPHQASMSLELGGTHIAYSDDLAQVIGDSDRILALLGCNTVDALRGELKSFGLRFLESGASVVIGSVATLNATYAPTVAALLVDELRDGAQNGHRFGQVMRQSRQRLFAAGYPIALALVAVGDAGWAFEPANPVSPEPITF